MRLLAMSKKGGNMKEETYRSTLVQVIQWMDCNGHSNSKIRRIVDLVLNHNQEIDQAIDYANREEEVTKQILQQRREREIRQSKSS